MSVYGRILLACLGSAALLLGAFGFQYLGGLAPCPMCLWQRWPHVAAVLIGALAMTLLWQQRRWLSMLGAAAMAVSAGLGLFHAGVEQGWWDGPSGCSGLNPAGMTADEMLSVLSQAPLVRCDEVVWDLWGITMAGWNGLISAGLAVLWVYAALPRGPNRLSAPV